MKPGPSGDPRFPTPYGAGPQSPGGWHNPYAAGPPGFPGYPHPPYPGPPKRGGAWKIVVLLGGIVGVMVILCGVGAFFVGKLGMQMVAEEVRLELRDNEALRKHVGEIEKIDHDFMATGAHEEDDVFVFNVKGDQGEGAITARLSDDDEVLWARLRLPSGEEVDLVVEGGGESGENIRKGWPE